MRFPPQLLCCLICPGLFTLSAPAPLRACIWIQGVTLEGLITKAAGAEFSEIPPPFREFALAVGGMPKTASGYADVLKAMRHLPPPAFFERFISAQVIPGDRFPPAADSGWPEGLDAAAKPLFHGRPEEARQALEAMNAARPGNYYILANLAVAEELCGRDLEALGKLETARRLHPGAHSGTEWMHAAVLRAKIALAADPEWFQKHTISGIPTDHLPAGFALRDGSRTLNLKDIHQAMLAHALARTLFVKPADPVTAALLKELARIEARWWMTEGGLAVLDLADEYGARDTAALRAAWKSALTHPYRPRQPLLRRLLRPRVLIPFAAGLITLALLGWITRHRRRKRIRATPWENPSPEESAGPVFPK